ncbi:MAG: choline monooxygenase [Acidimicrobiaceae bacterium]|nr:choline monooxygenase [Acidimicrobiaceae bacterium]
MHPGIAAATGYLLPPEAYWTEEWFEREQRLLFSRTWHLAASETELANPGDFVTLEAGFDPLVVVRGLDGELRCFHNLCRHRGMGLLAGCGNTRTGIVCPYHFWNFGLDGRLRRVPQLEDQFPGMDLASWGLLPGSVGTWGGMVFAHPDPDAGTLDSWLGELPKNIGSFQPALLTEVAHEHLVAQCNWKLFVENHVDVLHLWYLHAGTLADFDHPRFEWQQLGRNWVSFEPLKRGVDNPRLNASTTTIKHIDERDAAGLGAHAAFPNVLMATSSEFFVTYVARPVAPDRTVVDLRIRAEPDADAAALVRSATSFIVEDIGGCERVQASVRSSRFGAGPLARDHERPITLFHQHLSEALGVTSTNGAAACAPNA